MVVDAQGKSLARDFHTYDTRNMPESSRWSRRASVHAAATLYLNLEPCCTTAADGPCSDAVIKAGMKRVVAAMGDPNPKVRGKGFARAA